MGLNRGFGGGGGSGTNGSTWLSGAVGPTAGQGVNGDFYLDTVTGEIYGPKTGGAWGAAILVTGAQGAQGPQGDPGATGSQGLQGDPGATGAAGSNGTNGSNGATGATGAAGPAGNTVVQVEFVTASNPSATLGGGGRYIPLKPDLDDFIAWQFSSPVTGTAVVSVIYSMSVSNGGNLELLLDRRVTSDGDDPNATVTAGTEFTVTPGSNTTQHTVDSSDHASFSFSVDKGDLVYLKMLRTNDAEDTHTGDMQVFRPWVEVTP